MEGDGQYESEKVFQHQNQSETKDVQPEVRQTRIKYIVPPVLDNFEMEGVSVSGEIGLHTIWRDG